MSKKQYNLKILASARDEIQEIARLHMALVGINSARKITTALRKAVEHLSTYPYLGVSIEDRELSQQGYRKLVCGNYLCFYRLVDDTVFIYHIADGRTEYKHLFRKLPMVDET